jgi:hypothetical protein
MDAHRITVPSGGPRAWLGRGKRPRPKLIGQSVWLVDQWKDKLPHQRLLHCWPIKRNVDILTFPSPDNLAGARKLFPESRSELVLFGIPSEAKHPPVPGSHKPVKILAVGNDVHRDWDCAIAALRDQADIELAIA